MANEARDRPSWRSLFVVERPRAKSKSKVWDQAPGAAVAARAMDAAAECLRADLSGDGAVGRSSRGLAPATNHDTAVPGCTHWLSAGESDDERKEAKPNRMAWWNRRPPMGMGVEQVPPAGANTRAAFICAFHPLLRSIVDWEGMADGASANAQPGLGFTVVPTSSVSAAIVRRLESTTVWPNTTGAAGEGAPGAYSVLINAMMAGEELPADQSWPDLLLVFDQSQSEVGFEYGFIDPTGTLGDIDAPEAVRLLAYDVDGTEIARMRPGGPAFFMRETLKPGNFKSLFGVRSEHGNIVAVRLQFLRAVTPGEGRANPEGDDGPAPGVPLRLPQIVYRVWHEAFPPAAVLEEKATIRFSGAAMSHAQYQGTLPFHCDQVAAFLRGFRFTFLDGEPHPIPGPSVTLRVVRNGQWIEVFADGYFGFEHDFELVTYFSLVAWDSSLVDLGVTFCQFGASEERSEEDRRPELKHVKQPDPGGGGTSPVFAGVMGFTLNVGEPDHIERFAMFTTTAGHRPATSELDWPVTFAYSPTEDEHLRWNIAGTFLTGESLRLSGGFDMEVAGTTPAEPTALEVIGAILFPPAAPLVIWDIANGGPDWDWLRPHDPSPPPRGSGDVTVAQPFWELRLRQSEGTAPTAPFVAPWSGPRPPGEWSLSSAQVKDLSLEVPVRADMAFVALRGFAFAVDDEVRQLEVEVSAAHFDGTWIRWRTAAGVSTESDPGSPDEGHVFGVWPQFAAIESRASRGREDLGTRKARFRAWPGTVVYAPELFGLLSNTGDRTVILTDIELTGPAAQEFDPLFTIVRRGSLPPASLDPSAEGPPVFGLSTFFDHAPVRLMAGDSLLIGGRSMPSGSDIRRAMLVFATNSARLPRLEVPLENLPSGYPPVADLEPERIEFDRLKPGRQAVLKARVVCRSGTPVLIRGVTIGGPSPPFKVELDIANSYGVHRRPSAASAPVWQIDPGRSLYLNVRFAPTKVGSFKHDIVIDTNGGTVTGTVSGRCVATS